MLGRARDAAIKLDADENVTLGLHIGEGVETCLAAWLAGFRPVWALGSAGAIATFPVLSGIEAITVLGEVGDGGANRPRGASMCGALDRGRAGCLRGGAASRWRPERRVARGGAMTAEFPPPDARLAGKVKVVQFSAQRRRIARRI